MPSQQTPSIPFKTYFIGSQSVGCTLDEHGKHVQLGNETYDDFPKLLKALPELAQPQHLALYCELFNFMRVGLQFRFIQDPNAYQQQYEALMADKSGTEVPCQQYSHFDVSGITQPKVQGGKVVFYVSDKDDVPRCVEAPYPYTDQTAIVLYNVLPVKSANF